MSRTRWRGESRASAAAPSIRVELRRRRNGRPIRYRPGAAVTPPSCTTRPLRSNTPASSEGQVRAVAGRPDDRVDPAGDRAAPTARRVRHLGRREPLRRLGVDIPARSAQASRVSSSRPSLRSASAHTLGSDPENCAVPSRMPGEPPDQPHPEPAQRVEVERRPLRRADQLHRRQVARPYQVRHLVVALVEQARRVHPPQDVAAPVGARHPHVLADGQRHRPPGALQLLGDLDPLAEAPTTSTPPSGSRPGLR